MRSLPFARALALAPALPLASAINIVSSNDDGWAEMNIRSLYNALYAANHSVLVSAPADNQSGTGSRDQDPTDRTDPCQYDSCSGDNYATGSNSSDPNLNWVNSYPVSSIRYGIDSLASDILGGPPDLAVAGPNVGSNLGLVVYASGTVGAATYAAGQGIPGIAFSGIDGERTAWDQPEPNHSRIYADLATKVVDRLVEGASPYLPADTFLNVNFGSVESCSSAEDYYFVLSRIFTAVPWVSGDDVETCGSSRLPTENEVVDTDGCYASISVGTSEKGDADAATQGEVLDRLGDFLSCLD